MRLAAIFCLLATVVACSRSDRAVLVDLSGKENLSFFKLGTVGGTRDGDRMTTQVLVTDSASMLTLNLNFRIGTPNTTLENGRWRWLRNGRVQEGRVEARSVTFLGGQNGPPSVGGTFELIGSAGTPEYRVNLPVTPVGH